LNSNNVNTREHAIILDLGVERRYNTTCSQAFGKGQQFNLARRICPPLASQDVSFGIESHDNAVTMGFCEGANGIRVPQRPCANDDTMDPSFEKLLDYLWGAHTATHLEGEPKALGAHDAYQGFQHCLRASSTIEVQGISKCCIEIDNMNMAGPGLRIAEDL
jgi:hypothetical protein